MDQVQSGQDTATFESEIVHAASKATVTKGKVRLHYDISPAHAQEITAGQPQEQHPAVGSLLLTPLQERKNIIVEKGAGDSFSFRLFSGARVAIQEIIRAGLMDKSSLGVDAAVLGTQLVPERRNIAGHITKLLGEKSSA